jgi:signal transduction histidine kinase/FixJ family two-component response regulator
VSASGDAGASCDRQASQREKDLGNLVRGRTMSWRNRGRLLGVACIVLGAAALIALTWFGTLSATRTQRAEAEGRIAANVANKALVFQSQLQRQILEVDQVLRILARDWEANPDRFDMLAWRDQLVLLQDISPDVVITDETGTVRHDTVPDAVGSAVADRDYFRYEAQRQFDDGQLYISRSTLSPAVRQWHMNLARRLQHRDGSFAGVIAASLRTNALAHFYQMANIGTRGMIAVVGMGHGRVRVSMGPTQIEPDTDISDTEMFKAMQAAPDGIWVGRTAMDGVERVHGFHRVGDRGLEVVVAVDHAEAMQTTDAWESGAYVFAGGVTILVLLMAGLLLHEVIAARRREELLGRERSMLAAANSQLELAKTRGAAKTAQLEATLAGMTDGVAMVDGRLCLVEWNPRFPEMSGAPSESLRVGLPLEDLLRAQALAGEFGAVDIDTEVAQRMVAFRSGDFEGSKERVRPDGRVLELRRNKLPDGGFVTLYTDITTRKQAENALREARALAEAATEAMSRFVAIVSHEIRTPLNALLNSLTLLAGSGMAPSQQVLLDMARQSGDALMGLINDILEMSRMEAGQLTLRPSVFALRPLIESVLEMFGAQAAERGIALRMSLGSDVPDELYTDPGRLRQVLINLLSNAVKFAVAGEVRVVAETRFDDGAPRLRLAVRDRGPVIAESDRARLFQPFSQLQQNGSTGQMGSGLGLAICRNLVALMGGEIGCDVWTAGGREAGNEFWLTLPVSLAQGQRAVSPAADQSGVQRHKVLPRTRILLVEDIVANQLITATLLRREGHMVDIAGDGEAAVQALAGQPYDLVFLDIYMPGMSGLETTQRIRGMTGPAATVPIVALTANVCPEDAAVCTAAGMNGILGKPVALVELLDAIARHVWPFRRDHGEFDRRSAAMPAVPSVILSARRLQELRATLPAETLAGLVEECLADLSERSNSLRDAVQRQAGDEIHAHAHAMAGMAASYGMAALDARLRALLRAAHENPGSAAAMCEQLEAEIFDAGTALREALQIEMV